MGHKLKQPKIINGRTDFYYYMFRDILLVSIPLVIISVLVLSLPHSSAHSSNTDSLSLTLPTSCTLSASVTSAHTIEMVSGQYAGNIGNTRMSAYCNDNNGYYIYALGVSGNVDGNTDLVSNAGSNYNIHTGIYNSEGLTPATPSSWAMKLTAGTGTNPSTTVPVVINAFTSYQNIPSSSTVVAYRTSNTDMTTNTELTGSYIDATYEIYTSPTQPAGNYLGKVKYTMVHPYDSSKLTSIEDAFDIAGKDKVAVTDPATGDTIGSYYTMQDMSTNICNLVSLHNEPSQTQLVDIRDNRLYWVAKLDDEHCWMTQNLDFNIAAGTTTITSDNTDLSTDPSIYTANSQLGAYALKGNNTYGYIVDTNTETGKVTVTWVPESTTIASGNLSGTTWANDASNPYSYDKLDNGDPYYPDSIVTEAVAGNHAQSGNYYNWTAAIASNDSSSLNTSTFNNIANNPKNSICPKGWRLPTITAAAISTVDPANEFNRLNQLYNESLTNDATSLMAAPLYFIRSGYVSNGSLSDISNNSKYWSSTIRNDSYAMDLYFNATRVDPSYVYDSRSGGFSIRCLVR